MASYQLKYYANYTRDGHAERLEIHQLSSSTLTAKCMENIVSVKLKLQGDVDDIDSPIVKTLLDISVIDEWDKADTSTSKYGNWEEFYTPNALLYKVIYKQDGVARWTGFITPDSWTEKLEYHSAVTLTARDMLGHMKDFDFDADGDSYGMITVKDLIETGLSKAGVPMSVGNDLSDIGLIGGDINDTSRQFDVSQMLVNVEAFDGKTWYDAVESVLDGLGMTLRYADGNALFCGLLKDLPSFGGITEQQTKTVQFVNRTGTREMSPACRQIVETLNFQSGDLFSPKLGKDSYVAATKTINGNSVSTWVPSSTSRFKLSGNIGMINQYAIGTNPRGGTVYKYSEDVFFLSVTGYSGYSESNNVYISVPSTAIEANLRLSFTLLRGIFRGGTYLAYSSGTALTLTLRWAVEVTTADGNVLYYDDSTAKWTSAWASLTYTVSSETSSGERTGGTTESVTMRFVTPDSELRSIRIIFYGFTGTDRASSRNSGTSATGINTYIAAGTAYGMIASLKLSQDGTGAKHTTTTVLDESNNVTISRTPDMGQTDPAAGCKVLLNGFYLPGASYGFPACQSWWLSGRSGDAGHLDVVKHRMILAYHSKPLNVLTGTLRDGSANNPRFDSVWTYNGWNMLMSGGTLNILTGQVEGAALRQYLTYSDLWGDVFGYAPDSFVDIPYSGGTYKVYVTAPADTATTIDSYPSWAVPSRTTTKGSHVITITVSFNGTGSVRTGTIVLNSELTVTLSQNGASVPSFTAGSVRLPLKAGDDDTTSLSVLDPDRQGFGLQTSASWLHATTDTASGSQCVYVNADTNDTGADRYGTIYLKNLSGTVIGQCAVTQTGSGIISLDQSKCIGCGSCVDALSSYCPSGVSINMDSGLATITNLNMCTGCMECRDSVFGVCPAACFSWKSTE